MRECCNEQLLSQGTPFDNTFYYRWPQHKFQSLQGI